jgi:eukaryotic-like serine/threonine-protein kinase
VIGETLGNYRIVSTIGEGGMGVVYRAEHVLVGRKVAIKLLQPRMSHDADLVERFFNEARAAALIQHPGLVEMFDFGHAEDGRAFIVMELLEGESLTARLRGGRLPTDVALAIARQVASALHAAHEQGIVHRDLKPENIFLVPDEDTAGYVRTKVLDFGIAKLVRPDEQRSVKTRTGAVFGTPRYMSPEQCKNATNVDRRSDIYALGCILHEMLIGRAPFDYDSWGELVAAHIHETPPRPRTLDPQMSHDVERILLRATAKLPGDRFATMADFAAACDGAWSAMPTTPPGRMRLRSSPIVAAQVAPTLPVAAELSVPPVRVKPRRWWLVATPAVVVAGAIVGVIVTRDRGASSNAHTAEPPRPAAIDGAVAAATDATVVAADAAMVPAQPAARVHLVVESEPSGADVYRSLDGVRLGKTPLERELDRTDGEIELVVKLAGFRDAKVTMSTTTDGTKHVKLVRVPHRPPHSGSGSGGGPTVLDPYGGT